MDDQIILQDDLYNHTSSSSYSSHQPAPMDILASIFFAVAATWLLVALIYACLVVQFLRLRARGDLDRIYEADFGRFYPCGRRCGWYLPMGCLLRRYIRHLYPQHATATATSQPGTSGRGAGTGSPSRFMTRQERRDAMQVLLTSETHKHAGNTTGLRDEEEGGECQQDDAASTTSASDASEGYVCCICLGPYDSDSMADEGQLLGANNGSCSHLFHKDCILDWLQRQNQLECPCCRVPMATEDDVWRIVQARRTEKQKRPRSSSTTKERADKQPPFPSSSSHHDEQRAVNAPLPVSETANSSFHSTATTATSDIESLQNVVADSGVGDDDSAGLSAIDDSSASAPR
jgi:hypothetical protein